MMEQFQNIALYYAALFPIFFLSGLYISLSFLALTNEKIGAVYGADLVGAGAGALVMLAAMFYLHPFYLLLTLIPLWALAAKLAQYRARFEAHWWTWTSLILTVFLLSEGAAAYFIKPHFCQYKMITPALNVGDAHIRQRIHSPYGYYMVLDNFTERLDIDLSNNYILLKIQGPPKALGLYLDGNRISSFPTGAKNDLSYAKGSLDIFPYLLNPKARALLIGTRGGFRVGEALEYHAAELVALESDPNILDLIQGPLWANEKRWFQDPRVTLLRQSPGPYLAGDKRGFDIIDLSSEYLDQADANKYALTREALEDYWKALNPGGVVSLPVNIREFTVYALKLQETAREALLALGVKDPENHMMLYRSAWNARLLISKDPWTDREMGALKLFCVDRSFDVSFLPRLTPWSGEVYNDLPPTVWSAGDEQPAAAPDAGDALRDDSLQLLSERGQTFRDSHFFNLRPSTRDRPFFYSVLRLSRLQDIFKNLSQIPREEIGYLINLAVLGQSLFWALLVLILPFLGRAGRAVPWGQLGKTVVYFSCLGLGFLFIEIMLIEKGAYFLGDRTIAFSLVLCAMLVFSGLGSWLSGVIPWQLRVLLQPSGTFRPASLLRPAGLLLAVWLGLSLGPLDPVLTHCLSLSLPSRCLFLGAWAALASIPLGFFFPLGLSRLPRESSLIPWAWALNGAFSVVATPLANLLAVSVGYHSLLWLVFFLYGLAYLSFPDGPVKTAVMGRRS